MPFYLALHWTSYCALSRCAGASAAAAPHIPAKDAPNRRKFGARSCQHDRLKDTFLFGNEHDVFYSAALPEPSERSHHVLSAAHVCTAALCSSSAQAEESRGRGPDGCRGRPPRVHDMYSCRPPSRLIQYQYHRRRDHRRPFHHTP